jgi:hypothetical protein
MLHQNQDSRKKISGKIGNNSPAKEESRSPKLAIVQSKICQQPTRQAHQVNSLETLEN